VAALGRAFLRHALVVAARAVGGVPEILEDVPFARLILKAEPEAVAAGLREVMESGREVEELSAARGAIRDRFSIGNLVGRIDALYREELARVGEGRAGRADVVDGAENRN